MTKGYLWRRHGQVCPGAVNANMPSVEAHYAFISDCTLNYLHFKAADWTAASVN